MPNLLSTLCVSRLTYPDTIRICLLVNSHTQEILKLAHVLHGKPVGDGLLHFRHVLLTFGCQ